MKRSVMTVPLLLMAALTAAPAPVSHETLTKIAAELSAKLGESERPRIERGLRQAADFWRPEDGGEKEFESMARELIAPDVASRDALFSRMEFVLESYDGHMNEIGRDFGRQTDLDIGPIEPVDEILNGYSPSAHF